MPPPSSPYRCLFVARHRSRARVLPKAAPGASRSPSRPRPARAGGRRPSMDFSPLATCFTLAPVHSLTTTRSPCSKHSRKSSARPTEPSRRAVPPRSRKALPALPRKVPPPPAKSRPRNAHANRAPRADNESGAPRAAEKAEKGEKPAKPAAKEGRDAKPRSDKPRRERKPKPVDNWKLEDFVVEPQEGKTRFHDFNLAPSLMHAIHDLGFPTAPRSRRRYWASPCAARTPSAAHRPAPARPPRSSSRSSPNCCRPRRRKSATWASRAR